MRQHLILILAFLFCLTSAAQTRRLEGIDYKVSGPATASCKVAKDIKGALRIGVVQPQIEIDGRVYNVTKVEREGFKGCKSLIAVEIPNSVDYIGRDAFKDCNNLQEAVLPDNCDIEINKGSYGFGAAGPFSGCKSLVKVRGHEQEIPDYFINGTFANCDEVPYVKNVISKQRTLTQPDYLTASSLPSSNSIHKSGKPSFKEFASSRVKAPVEKWQQRYEFETMEQWKSRVNEETRAAKVYELTREAQKDYIRLYTPSELTGIIEEYLPEYETFVIRTSMGSKVYADVPQNEEEMFRKKWDNVQLKPVYGVMDGEIEILSCDFILGNKRYPSKRTYREDDFEDLALDFESIEKLTANAIASGSNRETAGASKGAKKTVKPVVSKVDVNIPRTSQKNENTFAVIIGNEDYALIDNVSYAKRDAEMFAEYAKQTLGIPEQNITLLTNATNGPILSSLSHLERIASAYKKDFKVIFYYAGHGVPEEESRDSYLVPVDVDGTLTKGCVSLKDLVADLGKLGARQVTVLLDACFSGSGRAGEMLQASRGVKIKPRLITPKGNVVLLSACSGDQSAYSFDKEGHGNFTYFLLEKLQDSKGEATLQEIADYVSEKVQKASAINNRQTQQPQINVSPSFEGWQDAKLK